MFFNFFQKGPISENGEKAKNTLFRVRMGGQNGPPNRPLNLQSGPNLSDPIFDPFLSYFPVCERASFSCPRNPDFGLFGVLDKSNIDKIVIFSLFFMFFINFNLFDLCWFLAKKRLFRPGYA